MKMWPAKSCEDLIGGQRHPCQPESSVGQPAGSFGDAQQREPDVFRVMALRQIERRPEARDAEEEKRDHHSRCDLLVPEAAVGREEPIGNLGMRAELDSATANRTDGNAGPGPGANGQNAGAV